MSTTRVQSPEHASQKNAQHTSQKHSAQHVANRLETGFSHRLQRAITNPAAITPDEVIGLQRLVGNRAVQQLLARRTIQARLTVGPAHDRYEQEAEQVAQQVISTPAADRSQTAQDQVAAEAAHVRAPVASITHAVQQQVDDKGNPQETEAAEAAHVRPLVASITPVVQRQADDEENLQETEAEEALQTGQSEQQRVDDEEEEEVRAKGDMQRPEDRFAVEEAFERRLATARRNGQPLPESVRHDMEARFGVDFSQVRIHTDPEADRLSQSIHAQAFTHGADIYFGAGRYDPDTDAGRALLAHELTHVVQQQAGRQSAVAQRLMDCQQFKQITPGKRRSRSKVANIDGLLEQYHKKGRGKVDLEQKSTILDGIEEECRDYQGRRKRGVQKLLEQVTPERQVIECLKESEKSNTETEKLKKLIEAKDKLLENERQTRTKTDWLGQLITDLTNNIYKQVSFEGKNKIINELITKKQLPKLEEMAKNKDTPEIMRNILMEILENKEKIHFEHAKGSPGADLLNEKEQQIHGKLYRVQQLLDFPEGSIEAMSSLVHEMTHIAVQAKFENTPLHLAFKKNASKEDVKRLSERRSEQLKALQGKLNQTNNVWTEGQKKLLNNKINYPLEADKLVIYAKNFKNKGKISEEQRKEIENLRSEGVNLTIIEFDSVINQMMYLMIAWQVDYNNEFYKKLREIAEEAYNYRKGS